MWTVCIKRSGAELYFLRRLRSCWVTWQLLRHFRWHLVCCCVLAQPSFSKGHQQTDKIIWKASSVLRVKLHTVEMVAESKMLAEVSVIMKCPSHPPTHPIKHYRERGTHGAADCSFTTAGSNVSTGHRFSWQPSDCSPVTHISSLHAQYTALSQALFNIRPQQKP